MSSPRRPAPGMDEAQLRLLDQSESDLDEIQLEKAQAHGAWDQQTRLTARPVLHSCHGIARCLLGSVSLIWFLVPTFVQNRIRNDCSTTGSLHPSAFLDGMRGLAAFAVFLCHLSYGTWDIVHTYGAGKPGENNWLIQLPIVRLFYSGPPMVAIFFVVSGYALSYKPIKLIRSHQREALLNTTSSSVFRRALRLYIPCFVSTFLVVCLVQLGVYDWTSDFADHLRAVKESHIRYKGSSLDQFSEWAVSMFNFVNIFDWSLFSGTTHFDPHLWTIPVEFRCSLLLFLTHVMTARMRPRMRLITVSFLCWWGLHWDRWDMIPFWCGQILAELHHIKAAKEGLQITDSDERTTAQSLRRARYLQLVYLTIFFIGCYLASFPDLDAHVSPGFVWLDSLIPSYWSQRHRFWPNIGAVMIVWAGGNANILRRAFASSPVQYLGKISFPLYVMHGPVINTFGYMTMQTMYSILGTEDRFRFEMAFLIAALMTIAAVVYAADVFWRAVDIPSVKFAKWVEDRFFES